MDATLLTILVLLVFATVLALVQRRRRDRCLRSFEGFRVTLVEDGSDVVWGRATVYASGLEIEYATPAEAPAGYWERSFLFYKEQYEAMGALYRYPEGLTPAERARRAAVIRATAQPGLRRRLGRRLRNWAGMVRDALAQGIGMAVGAAQARRPGTIIAQGGEGVKALSKEMIGYVGTAYDPMLERHLFRQVVLEVTAADGTTRSYCGWLKDYTSDFIEVVDAFANEAGAVRAVQSYRVGGVQSEKPVSPDHTEQAPATLHAENAVLTATNQGPHVLYIEEVHEGLPASNGRTGWHRPVDCVLPPGATADLSLPHSVNPETIHVRMGVVERIDLVVPRRRAVVRHAADGSEAHRHVSTASVMAEATGQTAPLEAEADDARPQ